MGLSQTGHTASGRKAHSVGKRPSAMPNISSSIMQSCTLTHKVPDGWFGPFYSMGLMFSLFFS